MRALVLVAVLSACSDDASYDASVHVDASVVSYDLDAGDDRDHDGLDDEEEARIAAAFLPYLSIGDGDLCPTNGLAVRVTPAETAGLVRVRYAWLFDRACSPTTIEGDGGSFATVVDPTKTGASAIISLRAIARRDTGCERVSTCGRCSGQTACDALGGLPAVWASVDHHAIYVDRSVSCTQTGACAETCSDASTRAMPTIVNVGEPDAPLVTDLTDEGFIKPGLGWASTSLQHYAPFGGLPFGGVVSVREMLTDARIDPPTCSP